jgi:hypothetical protein
VLAVRPAGIDRSPVRCLKRLPASWGPALARPGARAAAAHTSVARDTRASYAPCRPPLNVLHLSEARASNQASNARTEQTLADPRRTDSLRPKHRPSHKPWPASASTSVRKLKLSLPSPLPLAPRPSPCLRLCPPCTVLAPAAADPHSPDPGLPDAPQAASRRASASARSRTSSAASAGSATSGSPASPRASVSRPTDPHPSQARLASRHAAATTPQHRLPPQRYPPSRLSRPGLASPATPPPRPCNSLTTPQHTAAARHAPEQLPRLACSDASSSSLPLRRRRAQQHPQHAAAAASPPPRPTPPTADPSRQLRLITACIPPVALH